MKKWHKFIITADLEALLDQPISTTFEEHEFDFGGFDLGVIIIILIIIK